MAELMTISGATSTTNPPLVGGGTIDTETVLGFVQGTTFFAQVLSPLLSAEVINKTIGQALKDGFDCWGSTWTPTRAKQELPSWIAEINGEFQNALDVRREDLQASVNTFFKTFWGKVDVTGTTLEGWLGWRYDSAKDCTKRGLIALENGVDAYLVELEGVFPQIAPQINANITVRHETITLYRWADTKKKPYQKTVPQISVVLKNDVVEGVSDLANNKVVQVMGGSVLAIVALGYLFGKSGNGKKSKSKSKRLYR